MISTENRVTFTTAPAPSMPGGISVSRHHGRRRVRSRPSAPIVSGAFLLVGPSPAAPPNASRSVRARTRTHRLPTRLATLRCPTTRGNTTCSRTTSKNTVLRPDVPRLALTYVIVEEVSLRTGLLRQYLDDGHYRSVHRPSSAGVPRRSLSCGRIDAVADDVVLTDPWVDLRDGDDEASSHSYGFSRSSPDSRQMSACRGVATHYVRSRARRL